MIKEITKVKDVWTNFFYMPFIVIGGLFSLFLSFGFTLNCREEIQKRILLDGFLNFFLERYLIFFLFALLLTIGITTMSGIVVFFSTKDTREPIAVFKISLIINSITVFLGCLLFIYSVYYH